MFRTVSVSGSMAGMGLSVTRWGRFRELVQALRLVRLLRESLLADALTGAQRFIFSICYFVHKQVEIYLINFFCSVCIFVYL